MDDQYLQQRLDTFERNQMQISDKVDKMADAVLVLARVEERQLNDHQELHELKKGQDKLFDRLRIAESNQAVNTSKMGSGEKVFWRVFGGAVSLAVAIAAWNART